MSCIVERTDTWRCDSPGCDTQVANTKLATLGEPMHSEPPPQGWTVYMLIDSFKGIDASEVHPVICPECTGRLKDYFVTMASKARAPK